MARNLIHIGEPPQQVYDVLADPWRYPEWVIGPTEVTDADEDWPEPGSSFSYRAGGPVTVWRGRTRVIEAESPRRLVLVTNLPLGDVRIAFELTPAPDGTLVSLDEWSLFPATRLPFDLAIHLRNGQTLPRLKACVEGRAPRWLETGDPGALRTNTHWLDERRYAELFGHASQCYVGISTSSGPHVTPTAFTSSAGRLWIVAPRNSLKSRRAWMDENVSVLVRNGSTSVMLGGSATVIDPMRMWLPSEVIERAFTIPALARYLIGNRARLTGLAQPLRNARALNPLGRVLIAIAPRWLVLSENERIVEVRGLAPLGAGVVPDLRPATAGESLDLDGLDDDVSSLAEGDRAPAALGWDGATGPLVLPAHWHPHRSLVSVSAHLLDGVEGRVALCLDRDEEVPIEDVEGLLIRGMGRVVGVRGDYAAVSIDQDRATTWQGTQVKTVRA